MFVCQSNLTRELGITTRMFYDLFYNLNFIYSFHAKLGSNLVLYIIIMVIFLDLVYSGLLTNKDETAKENRKLLKYDDLKFKLRLLTSLVL